MKKKHNIKSKNKTHTKPLILVKEIPPYSLPIGSSSIYTLQDSIYGRSFVVKDSLALTNSYFSTLESFKIQIKENKVKGLNIKHHQTQRTKKKIQINDLTLSSKHTQITKSDYYYYSLLNFQQLTLKFTINLQINPQIGTSIRKFASGGVRNMQSQIVCSGCRSILLYPRGASNVCCALCNTVTSVPPPGMEMAQLICGGCRTLLMYARGATSVRCSCCHIVNLAPVSNQLAQVSCANCRTMLMYPFGAPSVKCTVCHYITNVNTSNGRVPVSVSMPSSSTEMPHSNTQTVVVENPMSVDENGKLVSNVVVGVTTDKKPT